MRKNVICLIFVSISVAACQNSPNVGIQPKIEYNPSVRHLTLQEVSGDSLDVFSGEVLSVTKDQVFQFSQKLGLAGNVIDSERTMSVSDGMRNLIVDKKVGTKFYRDNDGLWGKHQDAPSTNRAVLSLNPMKLPTVPSEQECKQIADTYLASLNVAAKGEYAFYQTNEDLVSTTDGMGTILIDGAVLHREIVFKRRIAGRTLHGPASQLSVFIGDRGKVIGTFIDWPVLHVAGKAKLRDSSIAVSDLTDLLAKQNLARDPGRKISKFTIQSLKLNYVGYFDPSGTRHVVPTYVAGGRSETQDGSEDQTQFLTASDDFRIPETSTDPMNHPVEFKNKNIAPR